MKTCFLGPEAGPAGAEGAPEPANALEGDSIETEVGERACMTARWKRGGMEVESCVVGGRMRRAGQCVRLKRQRGRRRARTNLHRGRRGGRRARGGHGCSSQSAAVLRWGRLHTGQTRRLPDSVSHGPCQMMIRCVFQECSLSDDSQPISASVLRLTFDWRLSLLHCTLSGRSFHGVWLLFSSGLVVQ